MCNFAYNHIIAYNLPQDSPSKGSGPNQNLRLLQYKEASVSTWITTEIQNGTRHPNDEIEHIGYRY